MSRSLKKNPNYVSFTAFTKKMFMAVKSEEQKVFANFFMVPELSTLSTKKTWVEVKSISLCQKIGNLLHLVLILLRAFRYSTPVARRSKSHCPIEVSTNSEQWTNTKCKKNVWFLTVGYKTQVITEVFYNQIKLVTTKQQMPEERNWKLSLSWRNIMKYPALPN